CARIELVHVALTDHDRAGRFQPPDHFSIFTGKAILINGAGSRSPNAHSVDAVLHSDRYAVQGTAEIAAGLLLLERLSLFQSLLTHHRNPGIDLRVVRLDLAKTCLSQFDRR